MRMSRRTTTVLVASVLFAGGIAAPAAAHGGGGDRSTGSSGQRPAEKLHAIGLSDAGKTLVSFRTDDPRGARPIGPVTGLDGDGSLVGIDFRVQDGKLYGVGDAGGIYVLDTKRAQATKVGDLSEDLEGEYFGVDFNPAANALRIVSDTGQNLRQPFGTSTPDTPDEPTVADGELTDPATPPATGRVPAEGVSAAAYTNNDLSAETATVLHDLDVAGNPDRLDIQSPANAGTLAAVGNLGVDAGADAGFDIYSTVREDRTRSNQGFAVLNVGGADRLYSVNLQTGQASDLGRFRTSVTDLAIPLGQR